MLNVDTYEAIVTPLFYHKGVQSQILKGKSMAAFFFKYNITNRKWTKKSQRPHGEWDYVTYKEIHSTKGQEEETINRMKRHNMVIQPPSFITNIMCFYLDVAYTIWWKYFYNKK
jgi:hypothetical protein